MLKVIKLRKWKYDISPKETGETVSNPFLC